jgi:hypothetical protein
MVLLLGSLEIKRFLCDVAENSVSVRCKCEASWESAGQIFHQALQHLNASVIPAISTVQRIDSMVLNYPFFELHSLLIILVKDDPVVEVEFLNCCIRSECFCSNVQMMQINK